MPRYPWHVLRRGRPVETATDGRRFYRDEHDDPVYEWSDDEVDQDPEVFNRWDEALDRERRAQYARVPRPVRRSS